MKKCLLTPIAVLFFVVGQLYCQNDLKTGIPSVMIKDHKKNNEFPLKLEKLSIQVSITENIATTTFDMLFYNDLNRILEGELQFPLGEGGNVSRFAMDVSGKLREGVVVEKNKGQQVFEKIVRRGVDPGLLEATAGNNFKARIYPIQSKSRKRVVLAFEQELVKKEKGYHFVLPMNLQDELEDFSIRVEVYNRKAIPKVDQKNNTSVQMQFEKWRNAYIAEYHKSNFKPPHFLSFKIPVMENAAHYIVDKGEIEDEHYFYLNIFPKQEETSKKLPKNITIAYDISASAINRSVDKELEILRKYIEKIGNLNVRFIAFSNDVVLDEQFTITNGKSENLIAEIKSLVPDGATKLSVLNLKKHACDEILLFTDGLSNFGSHQVEVPKAPINVINSSFSANHSLLQYFAMQTAGKYINLNVADADDAVDELTHSTWQFISADFSEDEISEVFPSIPTPYKSNFSLAGKLLTKEAKIVLNFGYGNKIMHTEEVALSQTNKTSTGLIERIWAQKKINELKLQYDENREKVTSLGKKYSIVTPGTSLIVLESLQDYLEFEIIPPEDMQKEYFELLKHQKQKVSKAKNQKLQKTIQLYLTKIEWWNDKKKAAHESEVERGRVEVHQSVDTIDYEPTSNYDHSRVGAIKGKVMDEEAKEPIPFANVVLEIDGEQITGATTDFDGNYTISPLAAGVYDLKVTYVGYNTVLIANIVVTPSRTIYQDLHLNSTMTQLDEVLIVNYKVPLINKDQTQSGGTVTSEEIARMPGRSTVGGVAADVEGLNVRGSRSETTVMYIDGVRVRGSQNIPKSAVDEVQSVTTGLPAKYGEASSLAKEDLSATITTCENLSGNYSDRMQKWKNQIDCKDKTKIYSNYLALKPKYVNTPAFYISVSDYLKQINQRELAIRVLSNLAELELENHELLRVLARKLMQLQAYNDAIYIFQKILELRKEEPQSYRDLGLAYAYDKQYQKAIDMLYQVVVKEWDNRFEEIESIVIGEMNAIIAKSDQKLDVRKIDENVLKNLPVDIRIVLNWDADNTDMDLWVIDPNGEKCYYENSQTKIGGRMSADITEGYGPEEFMLKDAKAGAYQVKVDYYGTSQQRIAGPVTLQVYMYTNFGRPNEECKEVTLQLSEDSEVVDVGKFEFTDK